MSACPLSADGVHRLAGLHCGCGWVLMIPPVCVSIEVSDGPRQVVSEGFNCGTLDQAANALRRAARMVEETERSRRKGTSL